MKQAIIQSKANIYPTNLSLIINIDNKELILIATNNPIYQ